MDDSLTPETDAFAAASSRSNPLKPHEMLAFAKRLERRLSLAQTEIKGHMRNESDLLNELALARADWACAQARIAELEKDWETDADYIRMAERIKELEKVASKFVERHDEIEPALRDVFTFYAIHGMKWPEDKNWKRELDALRDTLKDRA